MKIVSATSSRDTQQCDCDDALFELLQDLLTYSLSQIPSTLLLQRKMLQLKRPQFCVSLTSIEHMQHRCVQDPTSRDLL